MRRAWPRSVAIFRQFRGPSAAALADHGLCVRGCALVDWRACVAYLGVAVAREIWRFDAGWCTLYPRISIPSHFLWRAAHLRIAVFGTLCSLHFCANVPNCGAVTQLGRHGLDPGEQDLGWSHVAPLIACIALGLPLALTGILPTTISVFGRACPALSPRYWVRHRMWWPSCRSGLHWPCRCFLHCWFGFGLCYRQRWSIGYHSWAKSFVWIGFLVLAGGVSTVRVKFGAVPCVYWKVRVRWVGY